MGSNPAAIHPESLLECSEFLPVYRGWFPASMQRRSESSLGLFLASERMHLADRTCLWFDSTNRLQMSNELTMRVSNPR